jgi:hypothetical protein
MYINNAENLAFLQGINICTKTLRETLAEIDIVVSNTYHVWHAAMYTVTGP